MIQLSEYKAYHWLELNSKINRNVRLNTFLNNFLFTIFFDRLKGKSKTMSTDNELPDSSWIIKLRGLPWTVTSKDILGFLEDVEVINGENGVHLITYSRNHTRPNGEAFVECASAEDYKKAFKYDKKNMGHRYIESKYFNLKNLCFQNFKKKKMYFYFAVFSAKQEDFETIMRKQNIVKHDTVVKLRGLPWGVTEKEIENFFEGKPF